MKMHEPGVLPESETYFHTPSETARRLFFFLRCTGHYFCGPAYDVRRLSYGSFLLLHVVAGSGYCDIDGARLALEAGAFLLLDCHQPHHYGTDCGWEILWIHFDGPLAGAYYQLITETSSPILFPQDPYELRRSLDCIYQMYHVTRRANEAMISKQITNLLTGFLTAQTPESPDTSHKAAIESLLSYISENIDQPLTLSDLARRVSLSPFYFSRIFKEETGYTLRDFLLQTRVNRAKFFLRTTSLSLAEVAFRCGYGSTAAFCSTFKQATGATPMAYRKRQ